jgi:prefoldin subunit 5
MTDAVEIALIVGVTGVIPAVITAILSFANSVAIRRAERHIAASKADISAARQTIEVLEKNTNSIKDALVKVTGESEFAKGKLEGATESKMSSAGMPSVVQRQENES